MKNADQAIESTQVLKLGNLNGLLFPFYRDML